MAKKGGAHHGGAWKVAYADFVTAMMALFMVLWITAQDKEILLATSRYFKQPFNALTDRSVGIMAGKDGGSVGKDKANDKATAANLAFLHALASELSRMLNVQDAIVDKVADVEVTSDALRLTLYDRSRKPLFDKGSAKVTDWGKFAIQNLAWIIERRQLKVFLDGHVAAGHVPPTGVSEKVYGAWELSIERANAVRRLLEEYAVNPKNIERVTGYGDTKPMPKEAAASEFNDRITLSLSVHR